MCFVVRLFPTIFLTLTCVKPIHGRNFNQKILCVTNFNSRDVTALWKNDLEQPWKQNEGRPH